MGGCWVLLKRHRAFVFPDRTKINTNAIHFYLPTCLSFPGGFGSLNFPTLSCNGEGLVWASEIALGQEIKSPH